MEDWDLQAIVRGYTNQTIQYEKLDFDTFYDIPRTTTTTNLDDQFGDFHKFFPQTILSTPTSMFALPDQEKNQQAAAKFQELQQGSLVALSSPVASSTVSASTPPRPKRRRSNEKIVVEELTAERLTLDIWAWRKYGQKPIKGSPYPRSYYRCSSSKGCPARRRVEQSSTNPNMFIVTYSAEHDHDKPTKRSSLAGTSRRKTNFNSQQQEEEDQVITNEPNNISSREVKEQVMSNINENCERLDISVIPNVIFRENLLPTLEEMAGISSEWRFEFDG